MTERLLPDAPPRFLLEREEFALVHKPAHLLVHPTKPTGEPTLLSWLQEQQPGHAWSLIQRLDRETSGLLLAAKNQAAASALGKMVERREMEKEYLALVTGRMAAEHGVIDSPLGRIGISAENPIYLKQGVMPPGEGAKALTEYWRMMGNDTLTLLRVRTGTGRLHQIRVHLASIGHPVVGDKIYGPDAGLYLKFIAEGWTAEHAEKLGLKRHALHASHLRFTWQGETIEASDPLPTDVINYLTAHGLAAGESFSVRAVPETF